MSERKTVSTDYISKSDIRIQHVLDALMIKQAEQLTEITNVLLREGASKFNVRWVSRFDFETNPEGDLGSFHVTAERL